MAGINRTTGKATDLITFSRASGGTALRKISYGSELVTNGGFDTASDWLAGGGWSIGSGVASTTAAGNLNQSTFVASVRSKVVKVSYDIVSTMSGSVAPYFQQIAPTVITRYGTYRSAIGSYTDYIVVPENATVFGFNTNATAGSIDNISAKEVLFDQPDGTLTLFNHPTNIPRIEYAADGTVKGLLIEEQRVNFIPWSEDFDASWNGFQTAPLTINAIGPDGKTSAVTFGDNNSGGVGQVNLKFIRTYAAVPYTFSVFAKSDQLSHLLLYSQSKLDGYYFNLQSGEVGSPYASGANVSPKIEDFGNGWHRCSITFTPTAGSSLVQINPIETDGVVTVDLDGTSSILIYGAQIEEGSFPTSYIPTSGATATRAADIASISVDNFGYRQDAGTVVVQQSTFNDVKNAVVWQIDDGTGSNRYVFNAFNGNTSVIDGGVSQASLTHTGQDANVTYRHGFGYKLNSFASVYDGGGPVTDATGTLPTVSTLRFGSDTATNAIINGHIKSIAYYPRRLSNSQLVELTS